MKQNFKSGIFFAFLPLGFLTQENQILNSKIIRPELLSCREISSIEVSQTKKVIISTQEITVPKIALPLPAPEELENLFTQYATEYQVSSDTLKIIANCESKFNPTIQSKNGLYGGLFQYSKSTWISTRKAMGLDENPELRFDAEEAIKTTAFKIANGGIGAWTHCAKKAL